MATASGAKVGRLLDRPPWQAGAAAHGQPWALQSVENPSRDGVGRMCQNKTAAHREDGPPPVWRVGAGQSVGPTGGWGAGPLNRACDRPQFNTGLIARSGGLSAGGGHHKGMGPLLFGLFLLFLLFLSVAAAGDPWCACWCRKLKTGHYPQDRRGLRAMHAQCTPYSPTMEVLHDAASKSSTRSSCPPRPPKWQAPRPPAPHATNGQKPRHQPRWP